MKRKLWHTLLAISAFVVSHATTKAETLDLLDIWNLALQSDPVYEAAGYSSDADQEAKPQARAKLLPRIYANVGAQAENTRRVRTFSDSNTNKRALWNITLTQPIIDIAAWHNLERSDYILQAAETRRTAAYQDLILRVSQAYFNVLVAQDNLRAIKAEKQAIKTQLEAAQQSFELGSATITDTHEARARLDLLNANEQQANNAVQLAFDALESLTNHRPNQLARLSATSNIPLPEPNDQRAWVSRAEQSNLNVNLAFLNAKIQEKQLDVEKSSHYPDLRLEAQTGSASDRGILGPRPNTGPRSLDSSVGVTLSIPLFTGGEISSKVREQYSRLQQHKAELEASKRIARQNTQLHFSGVISGLTQIDALKAARESSKASMDANQLAYEVGVRINIDVLNAQKQLFDTERLLSQARYNTLMHGLQLKASSGTLNEEDLMAINALLSKTF